MTIARPRRAVHAAMAAIAAIALSLSGAVAALAADTSTASTADGAHYTGPVAVVVGDSIHVSGTGWQNTAQTAGSVIAVKLDGGAISTTGTVTNPSSGAVIGNKTVVAAVQADASGAWSVEVPYPTTANSTATWDAGQTHTITLLSGSLLAGDVVRSGTITFATVAPSDPAEPTEPTDPPTEPSDPPTEPTDPPTNPTEPVTEPGWPHDTVTVTDAATATTAVAWVESDVAAGDDAVIRLAGTGWVDQAGTGASTVAIKLNYGSGQQYTRTGDGIVTVAGTPDATIWTLLAPSNPDAQSNVATIRSDGSFEITLDAPDGLVAGQYLTVQLLSGRFGAADVQRTVTTDPLTVGGVAYTPPATGTTPTCVPTSATATIAVDPTVTAGGLLHVTGVGWCNPTANSGGSVVAVKLDEGAYSRLDTAVHANKTIWAVIEADDEDGTIDAYLPLPDGTTSGANGSTPAFGDGSHTLRLLTGSLAAGDAVRTLQSPAFVVGAYAPTGAPDPIDPATLTAANRAGVTASLAGGTVTVTVPGAVAGDWVYLLPFTADGSPRFPWLSTWFRTDAAGVVAAALGSAALPTGDIRLAVLSGNQGEVGELVGWAPLNVPTAQATTDAAPAVPAPAAASPRISLVRTAAATVPMTVPAAPFATGDGLTADNAGGVAGAQDGTLVTLTIPGADPGDWVYVYAFSEPTGVGWIAVDDSGQIRVDVAGLPAGEHKLAVLDRDGQLVGWAGVTGAAVAATHDAAAADEAADTGADAEVAQAEAVQTNAAEAPASGLSTADWLLIGGGALVAAALVAGVLVWSARRKREVAS